MSFLQCLDEGDRMPGGDKQAASLHQESFSNGFEVILQEIGVVPATDPSIQGLFYISSGSDWFPGCMVSRLAASSFFHCCSIPASFVVEAFPGRTRPIGRKGI